MKLGLSFRRDTLRRKPLRTFSEMADEFGLTPHQLLAYMSHARSPAPKKIMRTGSNAHIGQNNSWYDPAAFRAWWANEQKLRA